MRNYIFDVDGTLTPSRGQMDKEFANFFEHFATHNAVYLVTGSDRYKTLEQIPIELYYLCISVYQQSGNEAWQQDHCGYRYEWKVPEDLMFFLNEKLAESKFHNKATNNIEVRGGMVNFAIPGRPCSLETRHLYKEWDEHKRERENIAAEVMEKFPGITAQVAGETGIDIFEEGKDKGQVAEWLPHPITFFGDNMQVGGNDHPLAVKLEGYSGSKSVQVNNWEDTFRCLQMIENGV